MHLRLACIFAACIKELLQADVTSLSILGCDTNDGLSQQTLSLHRVAPEHRCLGHWLSLLREIHMTFCRGTAAHRLSKGGPVESVDGPELITVLAITEAALRALITGALILRLDTLQRLPNPTGLEDLMSSARR